MILRALVLAPLRARPWRTLATVLGIAAGVAAFVATLLSSRAAVRSLSTDPLEQRLELSAAGGVPEEALSLLRPWCAVAELVPLIEEWVLEANTRSVLRLVGVDPLVDPRVRELGPQLADATQLDATLRGAGVWISQPLAQELTLEPGSTLSLLVRGRPQQLPILGTYAARGANDPLTSMVIGDVGYVESLFPAPRLLDRVELIPRAPLTVDQLRAQLKGQVPPGLELRSSDERASTRQALVRSLEFNLLSLSGISLLVGAVLVATALASAIVERRKLLALCVSLGASRWQLAGALLTEASILGALGGVLGALGGAALASGLSPAMRASVETVAGALPSSAVTIEAWVLVAGAALGLVAALASSVLPLVEVWRTPALQALAREESAPLSAQERILALGSALLLGFAVVEVSTWPSPEGLPLSGLLAALLILAILVCVQGPWIDGVGRLARAWPGLLSRAPALRLALSSLAAGRRRAAWAAAAVGMSVALSVSIAAMVLSFRSSVESWAADGLRADLALRPLSTRGGVPLGELAPQIEARCVEAYGAERVNAFHREAARLGERTISLGASDLAVVARYGGVAYRDGRDSQLVLRLAKERSRVLINEPLANFTGLKEGDTLRIDTAGGSLERVIEGVFRDYGDSQGLVICDHADFQQLFPNSQPSTIDIYLQDPAQADTERERLLAALSAEHRVEVLTRSELRGRILEVFDRTFAITRALELISALVAVIAVLTVLYALLAERASDWALLRSLGESRAGLFTQVLWQAGLIGWLGALLGALAGLVTGVILVDVVNVQSFGWTITYLQPWGALLRILLLVAVFCALAGSLPAMAVLRSPATRVLREEG